MTLGPNILRYMYGRHATQLYGIFYMYVFVSAVIELVCLNTELGKLYLWYWGLTVLFSIISMILLLTLFKQYKFADKLAARISD